MRIEVTYTDPAAYVQPLSFVVDLFLAADTEMIEAVCEGRNDQWAGSAAECRKISDFNRSRLGSPSEQRIESIFHAANPAESRCCRIDSRKLAIWFQLGILRDVTNVGSIRRTWVTAARLKLSRYKSAFQYGQRPYRSGNGTLVRLFDSCAVR